MPLFTLSPDDTRPPLLPCSTGERAVCESQRGSTFGAIAPIALAHVSTVLQCDAVCCSVLQPALGEDTADTHTLESALDTVDIHPPSCAALPSVGACVSMWHRGGAAACVPCACSLSSAIMPPFRPFRKCPSPPPLSPCADTTRRPASAPCATADCSSAATAVYAPTFLDSNSSEPARDLIVDTLNAPLPLHMLHVDDAGEVHPASNAGERVLSQRVACLRNSLARSVAVCSFCACSISRSSSLVLAWRNAPNI